MFYEEAANYLNYEFQSFIALCADDQGSDVTVPVLLSARLKLCYQADNPHNSSHLTLLIRLH